MTWEVFLGIAALVSFGIAIITPITKLTKTMTELTLGVQGLKETIADIVLRNNESHTRLWDHNGQQDKILDNHEKRITKIELRMDIEKEKEHE
jgi:hypothetical protein